MLPRPLTTHYRRLEGPLPGTFPASFFAQSTAGYATDTSLPIQAWLAIRLPKTREAVLAFTRDILRTGKLRDDADYLAFLPRIESQRTVNK